MKKPSTSSRPTWLFPAETTIKTIVSPRGIGLAALWLAGCAANPNNDVLIDPLKQRLIAREDIALQNLLFARAPAYGYGGAGGGTYSYLDVPYDGPAVEPPLPDLNLLPEDMPPWEDLPQTPAPAELTPPPAPIEPVPLEAGAQSSTPAES